MKLRFSVLLLAFTIGGSFNTSAQVLVSSQVIDTSAANFLNFFANGRAQFDVVTYKIKYRTTDLDSSTTTASGAVSVPIGGSCDSLSLALYAHGTVLEDDNVPSRGNFESNIGKVFASTGHIAVMPDYLGLGDHPGLHPYVHAESEATTSLDAMRAARELLDTMPLQNEVLLTGYSQGGHAAMATAKYIKDQNLQSTFNLIATAGLSGPYDLSGLQVQNIVRDQPYQTPGYVVYLIMAMEEVYGNIYQQPSDFLQAPYDSIIPPYFDGTFPIDSVHAQLPLRASQFLDSTFFQNFIQDSVAQSSPLWLALQLNSNAQWVPQHALRMYYCTSDEQVNFKNALTAESYMQNNGAPNVDAQKVGSGNHGDCVIPAVTAASSFFDSLSTSCNRSVDLPEPTALQAAEIFPNPAHDELHLKNLPAQQECAYHLYDSRGAIQMEGIAKENQTLELSTLPAGIYFLLVRDEEGGALRRRISIR